MGKLYFEGICIFISSLVLMCSAAEQNYFLHDWRNLTWQGARTYCQVCFKELVTVTPENIKTISQNLTSDSWIGLRKNISSTGNSSMSWSRWADGEPLIFQNWYPGSPVFKSSHPKTLWYCSCPAMAATETAMAATAAATETAMAATETAMAATAAATETATAATETAMAATETAMAATATAMAAAATAMAATETATAATETATETAMAATATAMAAAATAMAATETTMAATETATAATETAMAATATAMAATETTMAATETATAATETATAATETAMAATETATAATATAMAATETATAATETATAATETATAVTATAMAATETATAATETATAATETATAATETATETMSFITFTGFTGQTSQPVTAAPTMPGKAECVRSPVMSPDVHETTVNYIEDSCVAMLSFGAWVERKCSELLSFICYDDRFFGQANVTQITSESAVLTWLPGPRNIDHYRVEVKEDKDDKDLKQFKTNNLTCDLVNLTAGTRYSVQVFPVRCKRDLDPQEIAFYTTPNKVGNLTFNKVTETSVFLSWNKPAGNVDFYLIEVQGGNQTRTENESKEVGSLTPGNMYTFTVLSGVGDNSTCCEESRVKPYTKPGKVSDLNVSTNTFDSLLLSWVPPDGNTTGFRVMAMNDNNLVMFSEIVNQTEVKVTPLPVGTEITLSVTALAASNTLEGDKVTVVSYTAARPVSNLTLVTTFNSLTATWNPSEGNSLSFTVELQLDGKCVNATHNLTEPREHFDGLMTAANYTVIVSTSSGYLKGPSVGGSKFTSPLPPTNASVYSSDKNQITFQWTAPDNIARASYSVRINASFWGHNLSDDLNETTYYRFDGLKSGTKYDFEVRTVADGKSSTPAVASHCTSAEEREISLSMSCSSAQSLLCDESATREDVFNQFHNHFYELLGDNIFWKLEKQEIENEGT